MSAEDPNQPPPSVRTVAPRDEGATRIVLVRHGEATCNVEGIVGGIKGCSGLTALGVAQIERLASRLGATGELFDVAALYASTLPRAIETARLLAPALEKWSPGRTLDVVAEGGFRELEPGEADGLTWPEFSARYPEPDWAADPAQPFAPGGESWSGFVTRAADAVRALVERHPGELVVVACHAGVIEATMLSFLPIDPSARRGWLRVEHGALTEWEWGERGWLLRRFNDATPEARSLL